MQRRTIAVIAVLAAAGLIAFVAYVQGEGRSGKAPCKTAAVEVQCVHMTNGAASEAGCCAAAASADAAHTGCTGKKDGKCSGDCTACPAMKEGGCAGVGSVCRAPAPGSAGQTCADEVTPGCESAKSGVCTATSAVQTGGCPGAQASSAKQGKCGGCPLSTK